jgi:two-component system cell cycle sensor histidine kinase/response regulator CckA
MTDITAPPARGSGQAPPGLRLDPGAVIFWGLLALGVGAAGVALTAGALVGQVGAILLLAIAAIGIAFLLWLSRGAGRRVGLFPERGAIETAQAAARKNEFSLLEALDEAVLVADRHGAAVSANAAYAGIARAAGALGDSDRPPMPDRLFAGDPAFAAPMYRLAKAAAAGQRRREELPSAAIGPGNAAVRYEASVSPMPSGRILWRLRELAPAAADAEVGDARRLFIDDAPMGFLSAKPDGAIVYLNAALRAVLGLGEDAYGLKLRDIVKDDPSRLLKRERRGFGAARSQIVLRAVDGAETPAQAVTYWPNGESDGATRTFLFFGEAQAIESSPAAAPSRAPVAGEGGDAFFIHAPYGAALLSGDDLTSAVLLDVNAALIEMTQSRAVPGAAFADLFEADEGPDALSARLRLAAQGKPAELKLATDPPTAAQVSFVRLGENKSLVYVVNATEQRELEQRLAQSEKMREIGLLAGGVAHDFNNVLSVVMQTTDLLLRRHPVGDPDFPDLNQINIHAIRAKELTEMLRAYARQQTFKVEVTEVSGFVAQIHEIARRLVGDAIQLDVRHGANLPFIKADKTQLERVLVNLVANARDAMTPKDSSIPKGGVLTLASSLANSEMVRQYAHVPIEDGDYVMIEVVDTGCGIKQEDQHKIFHPFHSTKDPTKGTGLGLATCYGIVKQSGGYIFFDSKVGRGTTFRIFLPAYQPNADEIEDMAKRERERTHRPAVDIAGRGRILLVEDDEGVRRITVRNLTECGFEVVEAENGEDALEILQSRKGDFDLILSDVSMPIMDGPEMLRAAGQELIGKAKVLFLSGYAPESFSKLLEEYPVSFLGKPVGATQLAQKVKELLAA